MFKRVIDRVRRLWRREPVATGAFLLAVSGAVNEVLEGGTVNLADGWKPLAVAVGAVVVRYFTSPKEPSVVPDVVQGGFDEFGQFWSGPR